MASVAVYSGAEENKMSKTEIFAAIRKALAEAPQGQRSQVMHLQMIKYAIQLGDIDGAEFCREVGLKESFKSELAKMRKITSHLISAGLDTSKI